MPFISKCYKSPIFRAFCNLFTYKYRLSGYLWTCFSPGKVYEFHYAESVSQPRANDVPLGGPHYRDMTFTCGKLAAILATKNNEKNGTQIACFDVSLLHFCANIRHHPFKAEAVRRIRSCVSKVLGRDRFDPGLQKGSRRVSSAAFKIRKAI